MARVSIYKNDLKYLIGCIEKAVKQDRKYHHFNRESAIERYINDKLKGLRTDGKPIPKGTRSPTHNTIRTKIFVDLKPETSGVQLKYDEKTLDPLCWVVENESYKRRFIILDKLQTYLNPPSEKMPKKYFARFPQSNPCFPATPAQPLNVNINGLDTPLEAYTNINIKDESQNITGTHKDRMALEVLNWYELKEREIKDDRFKINPTLSLLTYGCAGMAIQSVLGLNTKYLRNTSYQKTNINLLVPHTIHPDLEQALRNIRCNVFKKDLTKENLTSGRILELTENDMDHSSYDLTFGNRYDGREKINIKEKYYDYLSWEIINTAAKYIFLPYGSGDLYYNIISRLHEEIPKRRMDTFPLLLIEPGNLEQITLIGSTVSKQGIQDPDGEKIPKMFDKLYSPHFGENNNLKLCKEIIAKGRVNKKCKIAGIETVHLAHLSDAKKIMKENRINSEHSGLSGLLMFLSMKDELGIQPDDKVLIVNTGKLKYEQFL